jgi:hypothetical protein
MNITFSPAAFQTLKSTMPGHFTTLWESRSTSTPSRQLARQAAEYYYSAWAESVKCINTLHKGDSDDDDDMIIIIITITMLLIAVTNWEPHDVTLDGYCKAMRHAIKFRS